MHEHVVALVIAAQDFSFAVDSGEQIVPGLGKAQVGPLDPVEEHGVHILEELIQAVTGPRRDEGGARETPFQGALPARIFDEVELIEDDEGAFLVRAEFLENLASRVVLLENRGLAGVQDVNEEIGEQGFFESGLESLHEAMGETAHEADGIGQEQGLSVRKSEPSCGGVESGEKFILGQDIAAGQAVEEGRFPGVGVTDDGGMREGKPFAFFAPGTPLTAQRSEIAFEPVDALASEAPVDLELFLALAAPSDAAALAVEVAPHASQTGQGILEASQFNLETRFAGAGALVENVQDHFLPVDDAEVGLTFQGSLLGRAEFIVEDDAVTGQALGEIDDLSGLAGAHEIGSVVFLGADQELVRDRDSQCLDKFLQFLEKTAAFGFVFLGEIDAYEQGSFDERGFLADFKHTRESSAISSRDG